MATKIKILIGIAVAIIVIGCVALGIYLSIPELEYERAIRIARERFGIEKILWFDGAKHGNSISGIDKVDTEHGLMYKKDTVLGQRGGYYVIGLNKKGEEIHVLIPHDEGVTVDSLDGGKKTAKATLFDWPFAYSFSEMAAFMGEYGYKYADGVEGKIDEFVRRDNELYGYDRPHTILSIYRDDDREDFYKRLDVEFTFVYYVEHGEYLLTQEGGKLKLYEWRFTDDGITTEVHVYGE